MACNDARLTCEGAEADAATACESSAARGGDNGKDHAGCVGEAALTKTDEIEKRLLVDGRGGQSS